MKLLKGFFPVKKITRRLLKSSLRVLWELPTPKSLTFIWGFGSLLGSLIVVQVFSGVILAMYYVRGANAWDSVVELTREVSWGWMLRLVHRNTASFVFLVLYVHFFRGVIQTSFYLPGPWLRGWIIKALVIGSAFLGYVLPWGQMSFWGATVIINLIRVLPKGKLLVIWLWGGFYVSSFTCRFFYALHFLLPFRVLIIARVHLILLHSSGSSSPSGLTSGLKTKFGHLFSFKDLVNIILVWTILLWLLVLPDWSADPVNFLTSDLSSSPIHIQPEWYFLHFYAVLRSIPNKVGGLIGFARAFMLLIALAWVTSKQKLSQIEAFDYIRWTFFCRNGLLVWLGSQPVETPFIFIGQCLTVLYFLYIVLILIQDSILDFIFN